MPRRAKWPGANKFSGKEHAMSKFIVRRVASGIKFDLNAANGEQIATSEVYLTRAACLRGIASVRKNAPAAPVENQAETGGSQVPNPKFQLYRDKSGAYRFRLKARNGAIIAVSDRYTSQAACLAGIESVRVNAPAAEVTEA